MRLPYQEGSYFEVPLRNGRTGLGVVARIGYKGVTFGYFFDSMHRDKALSDPERYIRPEHSVLSLRFGDLRIIRREWTVLGSLANWSRDEWPLPCFLRVIKDLKIAYIVEYGEDLVDSSKVLVNLADISVENSHADFLAGAAAVEILLTKMDDERQQLQPTQ